MKGSKIKIIIVDDCKELCDILNEYLLNISDIVVVGIANDGIGALKLIQEKEADLVILDVIMPGLNGLSVLEKLKSMEINPMPKIIMVSAINLDIIIKRARELGAGSYVVKPFDLDIFVEKIRDMFTKTIDSDAIK